MYTKSTKFGENNYIWSLYFQDEWTLTNGPRVYTANFGLAAVGKTVYVVGGDEMSARIAAEVRMTRFCKNLTREKI